MLLASLTATLILLHARGGPAPDGWGSASTVPGIGMSAVQGQVRIRVDIRPPEVVAAGAQWRLVGETTWREGGGGYSDPAPGVYFLEFKPVPGWITPERDMPVRIDAQTTLVLTGQYQPLPRSPLTVTSTVGGFVHTASWQPMGTSGTEPPGGWPDDVARCRQWESAALEGPRLKPMPKENAGWRVRLHAVAQSGFQFVGWDGDAEGTRNPLSFMIDRPRSVQARFAHAAPSVSATQTAEEYHSPGTVNIHCQFSYPVGTTLRTLRWRPTLPSGWMLAGATGMGGPALRQAEVHFEGSLGFNPVQFNLSVAVPVGASGSQAVPGEVIYQLATDDTVQTRPVRALTGEPALILTATPSSAARLSVDLSTGRPVLSVEGVVGQIYALEQRPVLSATPPFNVWWFMGDVTLTNSPQAFIDALPFVTSGSTFYRATLLE